MTDTKTDIAIIGAGLSGLALAHMLTQAGRRVRVIEARSRVGGRIESAEIAGGRFDTGPAWIWPHNARMLALADALEIPLHRQYATGTLVFEDGRSPVRRDLSFSTMGDALRVAGGTQRLAEALAARLPDGTLCLTHRVEALSFQDATTQVMARGPDEMAVFDAQTVVSTLPPRLLAGSVTLTPPLPTAVAQSLEAVPTWMAGHAKCIAVYDRPFWREAGLSGDAMSHVGPLVELHDATDEASGTPALFGFFGVQMPGTHRAALEDEVRAQLVRLFGADAATPRALVIVDWAMDAATATTRDNSLPQGHPAYGIPGPVLGALPARLILAGTETARVNGGFLEGALEAAEDAMATILAEEPA